MDLTDTRSIERQSQGSNSSATRIFDRKALLELETRARRTGRETFDCNSRARRIFNYRNSGALLGPLKGARFRVLAARLPAFLQLFESAVPPAVFRADAISQRDALAPC